MAIKLLSSNDIIKAAKPQVDAVKLKLLEKLREATPIDTGFAKESWKVTNEGLENSADYIDKLNAGSSQQAGAYFIEQTLLSHPDVEPNGNIVRSL